MVTPERLQHIAAWSRDLAASERERACAGVVEKSFARGGTICTSGSRLDSWTGVVDGLVQLSGGKQRLAAPQGAAHIDDRLRLLEIRRWNRAGQAACAGATAGAIRFEFS